MHALMWFLELECSKALAALEASALALLQKQCLLKGTRGPDARPADEELARSESASRYQHCCRKFVPDALAKAQQPMLLGLQKPMLQ